MLRTIPRIERARLPDGLKGDGVKGDGVKGNGRHSRTTIAMAIARHA